jgi:pimeloyl-ACP methyl ester carboxylesterase
MTITVNGQTIFYAQCGPAQGAAVLLLHGWGTDHTLFRPLMELLGQKYRVLALDFPGFGQSPEPAQPWDVDGYADLVLHFLAALGVEQCILLGHSFGGRVIIKLCARQLPLPVFPKVILVGAAGIRPQSSAKSSLRMRVFRAGKVLLRPFPRRLEAWRQRFGSADYKAASSRMRQVLVKTVNEDLSALLPLVQPPVLLIWGRRDTATPLADGQRMEREIPHAGLAVLEGTHYAFLEQQAQFLRIIASFLECCV